MTAASPSTGTAFDPEQLAAFERDGFVVVSGLGDEDVRRRMLIAIEDNLERRIEPIEYEVDLQYPGAPSSRDAEGGGTPRRLKQAHGRGDVFTDWMQHPGVVGRLTQLLDPPLYCPLAHHNCVMTKEPRFSSATGWHQDIRYWSFAEPNLVNVWLALGEETTHNGCLRVIPGTHLMTFDRDRLDSDLFLRHDLPDNRTLIEKAVDVELTAGDVLFFHCRTFHAAGLNRTDQVKLSVVFTYRGEGNAPIPGSRSASLPELKVHD